MEDTTDAALKPLSRGERGRGEGTSRRGLSIVGFGEGAMRPGIESSALQTFLMTRDHGTSL